MSKRGANGVAAIAFGLGLYLGYSAARFIEIDKCLDDGGKWNRQTVRCESKLRPRTSMSQCINLGGYWNYQLDMCSYDFNAEDDN